MAARVSPAVRARAAQLRTQHGWSPAYALRQASAQARGLSPQQARGVHAEPQFRRILGARSQRTFADAAIDATKISAQVLDPGGDHPRFQVTIVTAEGESRVYNFDAGQKDYILDLLDAMRDQGLPIPEIVGTP